MAYDENTSIAISKKNREQLDTYRKHPRESWNEILTRVLELVPPGDSP